jgi:hypothetical protein
MPFTIGDYVMPTGPVPRKGERGFVIRPTDESCNRYLVRFPDGDEECDAECLVLILESSNTAGKHDR